MHERAQEFTREGSRIIILAIILSTGAVLAWLMGASGLVGAVDVLRADQQLWFWPALLGSRWLMAAIWALGDGLLILRLSKQGWLAIRPLDRIPLPVRGGMMGFADTLAVWFFVAMIGFFASETFICLVLARSPLWYLP
jgi:hypothetical protein